MNNRIRIRNSARNHIWIRIRIRKFFWIRYSPTLHADLKGEKRGKVENKTEVTTEFHYGCVEAIMIIYNSNLSILIHQDYIVRWLSDLEYAKESILPVCDKPYHNIKELFGDFKCSDKGICVENHRIMKIFLCGGTVHFCRIKFIEISANLSKYSSDKCEQRW